MVATGTVLDKPKHEEWKVMDPRMGSAKKTSRQLHKPTTAPVAYYCLL
jgi:hypothetical protein